MNVVPRIATQEVKNLNMAVIDCDQSLKYFISIDMSTLTQVNAKSCAKLQHFQQIPITSTDNLRNSDVKPANWLHKLLVKKAQLIIKLLSPTHYAFNRR